MSKKGGHHLIRRLKIQRSEPKMSVADKAKALKNELTGAATNKILCKASSHELAGPKKKHVDCKIINTLCTHSLARYCWLCKACSG